MRFLTSGVKLAFTELGQTFIKTLILFHFNPECYIWIKINTSGSTIGRVISQLTVDNLG